MIRHRRCHNIIARARTLQHTYSRKDAASLVDVSSRLPSLRRCDRKKKCGIQRRCQWSNGCTQRVSTNLPQPQIQDTPHRLLAPFCRMSGVDDTEMLDTISSYEIIGKDDVWSTIEDGNLKGMRTGVGAAGVIVSLSSRNCRDANRWIKEMPSVDQYPALKELDLHKMRYIHSLHDSVCSLIFLERLTLTHTESLTSLPLGIGKLTNLREVCTNLL